MSRLLCKHKINALTIPVARYLSSPSARSFAHQYTTVFQSEVKSVFFLSRNYRFLFHFQVFQTFGTVQDYNKSKCYILILVHCWLYT